MQLALSIIQSNIRWEDKEKNLAHFSKKIAAIDKNTDIIVLPEMFSTGFSMNSSELAEKMQGGETMAWLKQQAFNKNAVLVCSFIVQEKNNYFNRLIWMQPNGEFYYYDKKHLFTMAKEHKSFSRGKNRLVVHYKGWRFCPLICYDLRFPMWSRNAVFNSSKANSEFDCLIYIANWPTVRINHWDKLLEARAIENQCYVVGVNRIGIDENKLVYSGNSAVINPKGEKISTTLPNIESVETIFLSLDELNEYRLKFPVIDDADDFQLDSYTIIANSEKDS